VHLKSLRIQGFKTFARRTDLPFSRGITAIVGPNGSGKSNLVDAIRWGLGERNARGLRGHRMEDVIYAGGPGKSPVGMAEVSLLIDNADQRLNVEFNEIEVSRRLFRSGESDYLINGSRARLKDIDLLLASTGLRQDGYAVTAQNDIDYVIQAAPGLRRELIEEAAGVRRLRDQRQEALTRLAEAERDMGRARDILSELNPRALELQAQAAAAEDYHKVAEQLKVMQGSLARDAWRKAMVHLRRTLSRRQSAEGKRGAAAQALQEFAPLYAEERTALLGAREARWKHQEALATLRLRLAEGQHQARIAEERAEAATQAVLSAEREMVRLAASAQAGGRVVEELEGAAERTKLERESLVAQVAAAGDEERRSREELQRLEAERADVAQQRQDLHRDGVAFEAELRQVDGRLQFLRDQQQQAQVQLDAWSDRRALLVTEQERCALEVEDAERALHAIVTAASAMESRLVVATTDLNDRDQQRADAGRRVQALEAEVGALRLVRDRAQQQSPLQDDPELRRLLELIEVAPEDRAAVEAALEGWLYGWVATDTAEAARAVARLAEAGRSRETILVEPSGTRPASPSDGLTRVSSLVRAADRLGPLLAYLLDDVVVAADLDEARQFVARYPQCRAVTRAGEIVTPASYRGGSSGEAPLEVQAQVRATETLLQQAGEASRRAAEAYQASLRLQTGLLEERAGLGATLDAARGRLAETGGALAAARIATEREAQQESQVRQQLGRILALLDQAGQAHAETVQRHQVLVQQQAALADQFGLLEEQVREAASRVALCLQRRQGVELRAALSQQRYDDLLRQLERAREVWRSHGDDLAQRQAATRELASQPARIESERRRWLEVAEGLSLELAALERADLPDAGLLTTLEARVEESEQRNVQLQVDLAHADDGVAGAIMEMEAAQAEVDRCALALREDGQVVEEEEPIAEVDWQKTEREVSRLQRRLDSMGAVNLLAPQEYAQVRDRCDSLTGQLRDLESASAQLLELRQRLEHEIDERFRTVFHSVAINFQEFFQELFEGGKATLRLEAQPGGSPLDEGVEILAQTPGKRLQPLTLLSGGERALTALAFLFALQAVNPSPFYVLDEVDAALDDANVVRFNRVLRRLSADQQFLIVTHNHSTMAQAEVLYGVTLGDHGVSRIVSVRLEQDALMPVGERTA